MSTVLFVCAENSARSQMAEAYFNQLARVWKADSAGTLPGPGINPTAVLAMSEDGIDISRARPKALDLSRLDGYDRIISFGCIVKSVFPARDRLEEWPLEDPARGDLDTMRKVRDEIRKKVSRLVEELEGGGNDGRNGKPGS